MTAQLSSILYVEDDGDIAEVAVMTLEDIGGFEVTHCASGRQALERFESASPQLILMDVMMPEMDGPETVVRLRQASPGKKTPVIFMTAKAQVHEQSAYRQMGAIGVVVKPFDPMKLCQQINDMWEDHHATQQ